MYGIFPYIYHEFKPDLLPTKNLQLTLPNSKQLAPEKRLFCPHTERMLLLLVSGEVIPCEDSNPSFAGIYSSFIQ